MSDGRRDGGSLHVLWVVGAVVLLALVGAQTPPGRSLLTAMGVTPTPVPFLELSFANPTDHPQTVVPGQWIPVSFVLSAHAATYTDVTWRVATVEAAGIEQVAQGTVTVPAGETRTVTTAANVRCDQGATAASPMDSRAQVRVTLDEPDEEIHFWVACENAPQ